MANIAQTIQLPDGSVLEIEEGTPQNVIDDYLKQVTAKQNINTTEVPVDLPWYEDAYSWIKENPSLGVELPMGLAGSALGTAAGIPFGPLGMVVGGVVGGALGSGGGSVAADVLQDVPIDYADALQEAAISAGIDVATLGAGSKLKTFFEARKALGVSPQEAAEQLINRAREGMAAGSEESLQATQRLLQEGGATLLPSQTKRASNLQEFSESIAEIGILSSERMAQNASQVNRVIEDHLNRIIQRNSMEALDSASLGQELGDIVSAGRQAMVDSYGSSLDQIMPAIRRGSVSTKGLRNRIKAFRKTYVTREIVDGKPVEAVSNLSPQTASFMAELNDILKLPTLSGESLIALDKKITQKITQIAESLGKGESGVGTADLYQLRQLSDSLKEGIQKSISVIDPTAAADYQALKKAYAENMDGLLPRINATMLSGIADGRRGTEVLGRLLVTARSPEKIEAFMKSIDTAYSELGKDTAAGLTFKTAEEAKQAIRASFLEKTFSLTATEGKDFSKYASLAERWGSKDGRRALTAVFGEDTPRVIQLVNMMAETSQKQSSNLFGLSMRGKEVGLITSAPSQALAALGGQFALGGIAGLASAAGILGLPVVLARAATNPKTVNKLIAFEKRKFSTEEAKQAAAGIILTDIVEGLSGAALEEFKTKVQLEEKQRGL